jgi:hypothetical protein
MSEFVNHTVVSPKLILLSERHDLLLEEYRNNLQNLEFRDFTNQQQSTIKKYGKGYTMSASNYLAAKKTDINIGGWHVGGVISYYREYERNTQYLPRLLKTLRDIGNVIVCGINVLDPNTSLEWHDDKDYDPTNDSFRIIWGLDIQEHPSLCSLIQVKNPESGLIETKIFKNKEFYIFKPSKKHRVENNLPTPRSVLCIDIQF